MTPWLDDGDVRLYHGDALEQLALMPSESVQCIVTSPPFWGLRSYIDDDHADKPLEHGLEPTPDEWCAKLVAVMREARRVLRNDGVCWIELGDTYAASSTSDRRMYQPTRDTDRSGGVSTNREPAMENGRRTALGDVKPKDLVGAPWLLAFALRADGWYLRAEQIWHKVNPMPESVTDRPTRSHSTVFLLSKSARYFFDSDAIREGEGSGRNARSVWSLASEPFSARALGGGISYRASADCPDHGLHADPEAWQRAAHGAPPSAGTLYRIDGTDACRALGQPVELASTPLRTSEAGSSATPHNTRSHRTALAPETTQPCTPSGGTTLRTAGTLDPPASAETHASTPASSTDSDGSLAVDPSARTALRIARKCSCEKVITDHFATFPQALVERCIKAGTSEHGACSVCGAPWRRITERERIVRPAPNVSEYNRASSAVAGCREVNFNSSGGGRTDVTTLGWERSCDCVLKNWRATLPVPCVVLDPFMGSGTTALVARRLGRHAIGIELNLSYLEISATRLQQLSLLGGHA